jgi:hypothetical protein
VWVFSGIARFISTSGEKRLEDLAEHSSILLQQAPDIGVALVQFACLSGRFGATSMKQSLE